MTVGAEAPLCFTTVREVAHIILFGSTSKMPQQAVVIYGTSAAGSIAGNSTSACES